MQVFDGDRLCLVGRNGSGKSTLLKIAAGMIEADKGERFLQPGVTVRYLPQEPDLSAYATTLAYVEAGLAPGDEPYRAHYLLEQLGLTGEEMTSSLSGGEIRRAALARTLAPSPDILLLDEPTNHLDLPAIEWLESELKQMKSALVLISHDRRFLQNLSRRTVWLDRGISRQLEKGFAAFEDWRDRTLEEEADQQHKLARQIVREEHWIRYGVTARRKRNMRRVHELSGMRQQLREAKRAPGAVNFAGLDARASGKQVAFIDNVSIAFGDRTIVKGFSTRINRGDRLGIIGPNGAGKTTLVRLITGQLQPDTGKVKLGANLDIITLDQKRESLDPSISLKDAMTQGSGDTLTVQGQPKHVMSYLKDFLFTPEQAGTPVGVLSGGERARLMLAMALKRPSNVMILDEPTNDLDLETLDLLQEFLDDYDGTVILVSHDRDFLDRISTSVIASDGDGVWKEYAGGYSDMVVQKGSGVVARKAETKESASPKSGQAQRASAPAQSSRARLSFKQKFALENLPKEIAEIEKRIAALNAEIADPGLYARDRKRFDAVTRQIADLHASQAAKEEEWLELEMLREAAEA